jgi:hypothetical protein
LIEILGIVLIWIGATVIMAAVAVQWIRPS